MKYLVSLLAIALLFNCSKSDNDSEEEQFCGVYEGNIFLPSDDAIREFGKCNYTEITGYLSIGESSYAFTITDLSPLSSITKVGGALQLSSLRELNSLNGLHNIESASRLHIAYAVALENLDDLDKLQTSYIELSNNYALKNIDGLDMESDTIGTIAFFDCPSLINLNAFLNIKTSGYLGIKGCDSLTSLQGLNSLETINGGLSIRDNFYLESLDELSNLTYLKGDIFIRDNPYLRYFCGLKPLFLADGHIDGDFEVGNNFNNPTQTMIMNAPACD